MLVKYWMKKKVVTVDVNDSLQHAITTMKENQASMLPVLKNGELVGIVTDRDLKRASASDATVLEVHELAYLIAKLKVSDIMSKNVITVPPNYTLEETSAQLLINNISGVPVVDDQRNIVGMITSREIFLALLSLTGFGKRGVQFAFEIDDHPGSIKEITDVIRSYGGRLVSILTSYEETLAGKRRLYVRAWSLDRQKMPQMLEDLKKKGTMLYMVDHRENKREEFVDLS